MADGSKGGWGDGPFSKRGLLEVAARSGAIYTAKIDGVEVPYDGALFHAEELEREGMFEQVPDAPTLEGVKDYTIWRVTALGAQEAAGGRR